MIRIFNLQSLGETLYLHTYNSLVSFFDSKGYKSNEIKVIQDKDFDIIQIGEEPVLWNFIVDFDSEDKIHNNIVKCLPIKTDEKFNQTILITDKAISFVNLFDFVLITKKSDVQFFLLDYLALFFENNFPANFDRKDVAEITKGKILKYNRMIFTGVDFKNQLNSFHKNILSENPPILYGLKLSFNKYNIIEKISEIDEVFLEPGNKYHIWSAKDSENNEFYTLTEYLK